LLRVSVLDKLEILMMECPLYFMMVVIPDEFFDDYVIMAIMLSIYYMTLNTGESMTALVF